ncbi:MAG: DUF4407 domain-containing protein, partial [Flavobacteriales bacterium]|nr:DUF4407 domain-containing protein [Flavobacteriales bacterium]
MTTQIYARIIGLDPEMVKNQTTASRLKILTLGQLILIPVGIWFISGMLIAHTLVGTSWTVAIIAGLTCGTLIYIIDRSFVTTFSHSRRNLMFSTRLVFALLSAILGSAALDTTLFQGDIDAYQKRKAKTIFNKEKKEYKAENNTAFQKAELEYEKASEKHKLATDRFMAEMHGDGSGYVGYKAIAKKKEEEMKRAGKAAETAKAKVDAEQAKLEKDAENNATTQAKLGENTIMTKVRDLHEFAFSNTENAATYIIFLLVVLLAEIMLIIYKSGAAQTVLEETILAEEHASRQKI